jgi:hypothetical protein
MKKLTLLAIIAAIVAVTAAGQAPSSYDSYSKVKEGSIQEFLTRERSPEYPANKWSVYLPSPACTLAVGGAKACSLYIQNTWGGDMSLAWKMAYAKSDSAVVEPVYKLEVYPGVFVSMPDSIMALYKCAPTGTVAATATGDTSWYVARIPNWMPQRNYLVILRGKTGNAAGTKVIKPSLYRR